jgi:hypothetical protein
MEQTNVENLKTGQKVTSEMSLTFQDYTTGVYTGDFGEPVKICSIVGRDKRWNARVMKNGLMKYLYPREVPALYVLEQDGDKFPVPEPTKTYVNETLFPLGQLQRGEGFYEEHPEWHYETLDHTFQQVHAPDVLDESPEVFDTPL